MMGVDDIVISFAISYIAGSIPALTELLKCNKIEDRLDACYQKALSKWTTNDSIRRTQSARMYNLLPSLVRYIQKEQQEISQDIKALIICWANELRSDNICYEFMIENQMIFMNRNNDKKFHDLIESLSSQFDSVQNLISGSKEEIIQVLETLQTLIKDSQTKNSTDQLLFITNILKNNIEPLIIKLNVKTALSVINTIEVSFPDVINKNQQITTEIKSLKMTCTNLLERKHKITIKEIDTNNGKLILPDSVTLENLNEWISILYSVKQNLGDGVPISREHALIGPEYKLAYKTAHQFFSLLERTEITNAFPLFRAFYHYWSFIVKNNSNSLKEFQRIEKTSLGENIDYFRILEATMLIMDGEVESAFFLIMASRDSFNTSSLDLTVLLSMHTHNPDYIIMGLKTAIKNKIEIGDETSQLIAFVVNKESSLKLLLILPDLIFKNETNKIIITELCKYNLGRQFDVSFIEKETEKLSETMLAYAAYLMAQHGDVSLAFKILNPKIQSGELDLKQTIFINILGMSNEYKPHLYRLLQENRKQGLIPSDNLLIQEFNLAVEIAHFENALEIMRVLYNKKPEDENILANYIKLLAQVSPEELEPLQNIVSTYQYTNSENIIRIYSSYGESGYLDFATEFLTKQQYRTQDDNLKHFFYIEAHFGFIKSVVNKEYESAEEGLSILYRINEIKRTIILKTSTPLGKVFLGRKKGDTVDFNGMQYHIEGIFSQYFKVSADYITDLMNTGGNQFMHLFTIDKDDLLGSLEAAVCKFNPDSKNYEKKKNEYQRQYENNELGLIQLIDETNPINSYYKYLFTSFKIYINPCNIEDPGIELLTNPNIRFVLDLPACIMLFEFSLKYNYNYKTRFKISSYLYEVIKRSQKYILHDIKYDMFEAITSGYLQRVNCDPSQDCIMRVQALTKWVEDNCDIEVMPEALAINSLKESKQIDLLANTVSCLMVGNNCLVSDDKIYKTFFESRPTIITTEALLYLTEDKALATQYSRFMMECKFLGTNIEDNEISAEYLKLEKGEDNYFQFIIENGRRNPYQLSYAIQAGVLVAKEASDLEFLQISFTNLFTTILEPIKTIVLPSEYWQTIQHWLNQPYPNFMIIKSCLLKAKTACENKSTEQKK